MPRTLVTLLLTTLLTASFAACGDDDDGGDPTVSADPSRTATATATVSHDKETPTTTESVTPVPQSTGTTPTAPPVNPSGTRAVEPPDADEFISRFQGMPVEFRDCAYNPATALVNCGGLGTYGIDPPITGQDITCTLWEVNSAAVAIQCQVAEPLETRYYEIRA
jgi:hypothetical protein